MSRHRSAANPRRGGPVWICAIGLAGLVAAGLGGCGDAPESARPAEPAAAVEAPAPSGPIAGPGGEAARTAPAKAPLRRGRPSDGTYVGVVLARQAVEISSQEEGRLLAVNVRVGDTVRTGTTLATLETQQLNQDVAMATASLRAAEAAEKRAAAELQKSQEKYNRRQGVKDLFSLEDIEAARTEAEVAAASLDTARAQVAQERARARQLENRVGRSTLRSPIDGKVALRYLDPGAVVRPGTVVVRLISSNQFLLRFAVPPDEAGHLQLGRRVAMRVESPDMTLQGTISRIAPQVDSASQMIFVEAEVQEPPAGQGQLQDGLSGRVSVLPG